MSKEPLSSFCLYPGWLTQITTRETPWPVERKLDLLEARNLAVITVGCVKSWFRFRWIFIFWALEVGNGILQELACDTCPSVVITRVLTR
jgi:hypothetical protein